MRAARPLENVSITLVDGLRSRPSMDSGKRQETQRRGKVVNQAYAQGVAEGREHALPRVLTSNGNSIRSALRNEERNHIWLATSDTTKRIFPVDDRSTASTYSIST